MTDVLGALTQIIENNNGIGDKQKLAFVVRDTFSLTKDRSVYYNSTFAIRFSASKRKSFSNTVLSLSNLQKVDDRPFVVCLVTPHLNYLFLANSTFLKKVSHSSQDLRVDNIRGSFNGSDIYREFEGTANIPENFEFLFNIHSSIGFEGNLPRLVDATNNIVPQGQKTKLSKTDIKVVLNAPERAIDFVNSDSFAQLKIELDEKVNQYTNEIVIAGLIENVNIRGRVIEYLIAGEDAKLRDEIIVALRDRDKTIPEFKTENSLGDYSRVFGNYRTETDVKTKIMILDSNPKAYNLDKVLDFLTDDKSVFLFYFVGLEPTKVINTVLVSMFQERLLKATLLLRHWAGRNSRGVSQFVGKSIGELILNPDGDINIEESREFLRKLISL